MLAIGLILFFFFSIITLGEIMDEYGANGAIIETDGNGSADPGWVWEADLTDDDRATPLMLVSGDLTIINEAAKIYGVSNPSHMSAWIITGQGDNPARHRCLL